MVSLSARLIKAYTRRTIKKEPRSPEHLVRHLRRYLDNPPLPVLLPAGVTLERFAAAGVQGDRLGVAHASQAVLYFHGGGFIAGVTRTYRTFCAKFAKALQAEVYLPSYRRAPEHPFPAAVEDAMAAYQHLLEQYSPGQISFVGDSAGGALAISTLLALRDAGFPLPKCAVAFSPFADMTAPPGSRVANHPKDDMFTCSMYTMGMNLYARTEEERRHPHASPVFGDFQGLPPLLITVDEGECLRDDSYLLVERARQAGVSVRLISRDGLLHVWPIFYPLMPEAREDVERTIRFIRNC